MAGQDTTELTVASHGDVYVAPVGTALPTTVTGVLNAAFFGLGLISEDGCTISISPTIEEFHSWQRRQAVRRELTGQEIQAHFTLQQWNAENVKLAFGGGQVSEPTPGSFRYDLPSGTDALDERAVVIDWQDGPNSKARAVFAKANVIEAVEVQLVRNSLAMLPVTLGVNAPDTGSSPGYFLFDDSAFHS